MNNSIKTTKQKKTFNYVHGHRDVMHYESPSGNVIGFGRSSLWYNISMG